MMLMTDVVYGSADFGRTSARIVEETYTDIAIHVEMNHKDLLPFSYPFFSD